jgi:alanyl-tRNA synthetase
VAEGTLKVGAAVELQVDTGRRSSIRGHHSATHLLHEALRRVLGDHVAQKGSLVEADRLRFDFSHPKPMTDAEIAEVEDIANRLVLQNEPVVTRLMAVDEAVASGARALFGEKYGDEVRVVSMGTDREADGRSFSIELCGGTHVVRTGDIGLIVVLSEGAVAAGVRRIEALTGEAARRHLAAESRTLREVAGILKAPVADAPERLAALVEERRRLERELGEVRRTLAMGGGGGGATDDVRVVSGVNYLGKVLRGVPAKDLKPLVDEAKKRVGSGVVAFVAVDKDERASLIVGVTPDQVGTRNAVDLVRVGAAALGGKGGGGRPDMAQAGGPDGGQAEAALAAVEAALAAA